MRQQMPAIASWPAFGITPAIAEQLPDKPGDHRPAPEKRQGRSQTTSEEEAITTALKKAGELLSDEKAQQFYLDNFVKLEFISINDKSYHYPQKVKARNILHDELTNHHGKV